MSDRDDDGEGHFRGDRGFLVGKSAKLADWYAKKEQKEYDKLFNRLRASKWQREVYEAGGDKLDKLRARKRAHANKPEVQLHHGERAKLRRRARYYADPPVYECRACGARWCPLFGVRGPKPEFCGDACRQRYRYQERPARTERVYTCGRCGEQGHSRRGCPKRSTE
jgi:hypothetical protein